MVQPFFATPPAALSFFTRAAECVDAGVNIARDVPARFSDNLEIFTWLRILHLIRLVFAFGIARRFSTESPPVSIRRAADSGRDPH